MSNPILFSKLKRTIPTDPDGSGLDALLAANDYPPISSVSDFGNFCIIGGTKITSLEAVFTPYVDNIGDIDIEKNQVLELVDCDQTWTKLDGEPCLP